MSNEQFGEAEKILAQHLDLDPAQVRIEVVPVSGSNYDETSPMRMLVEDIAGQELNDEQYGDLRLDLEQTIEYTLNKIHDWLFDHGLIVDEEDGLDPVNDEV